MSDSVNNIEQLAVNTIRLLAVDGVQKANSGHPGMPMGCAPIAYSLYSKLMKHNPANPKWINRDRFILSSGHGSMLLYSILHLTGYGVTLEDLKNFRQIGSITPGHPENTVTPGVEVTTGPLGQGFANAVGFAMAQNYLAAKFNKPEYKIVDHFVYGICGDGDMMEGISHEAASLAGHLKLGKIIFFYDDNKITIDGKTDLSFSDNTKLRFEAYNWHVQVVEDGNDLKAIETAVLEAKKVTDKPSLIITKTHIGYGSPNKQDTSEVHGSPLGAEEIKLTKKFFGFNEEESFFVPDEVKEFYSTKKPEFASFEDEWNNLFAEYAVKFPEEAKLFNQLINGQLVTEWEKAIPVFEDTTKPVATRVASGKVLNAIAPHLPGLFGGSADLAPSNNTYLKDFTAFSSADYSGKNIHFGIREHVMGAIMNAMSLYGGIIPYGGTFLIFSDYLRHAIRLGSLSEVRNIYVLTHDSIGLGEDGPTHQPVEQLAALRAIPGVVVIRPADANETAEAWRYAIKHTESPVLLILTRQNLMVLDQKKYASASNLSKGGYTLKDSEGTPDLILIASGSEVELALKSAEVLESEGKKVRVVSMPCRELFDKQPAEYKQQVLPKEVGARVSIETGIKQGWERYTGDKGANISMETFGASGPYQKLMEKFGYTVENVCKVSKSIL